MDNQLCKEFNAVSKVTPMVSTKILLMSIGQLELSWYLKMMSQESRVAFANALKVVDVVWVTKSSDV